MVEENWIDCICYSINFINSNGNRFERYIVLPINFPKDNIESFFKNDFKGHEITIIDITEMNDIWLSRHYYSSFVESDNFYNNIKIN